jgi:hypothetical protein
MIPTRLDADFSSVNGGLVSRAGLAGGGAPKMTHARPPLTHSSWVNGGLA